MLDKLVSHDFRSRTLRTAAPRVGEEAAIEYVKVWEAQRAFALALAPPVLTSLISAALGFEDGILIFLVLLIVPICLFVARQVHRHRMFRAASAYLGVKINWIRPIHLGDNGYDRWLATHPNVRRAPEESARRDRS